MPKWSLHIKLNTHDTYLGGFITGGTGFGIRLYMLSSTSAAIVVALFRYYGNFAFEFWGTCELIDVPLYSGKDAFETKDKVTEKQAP